MTRMFVQFILSAVISSVMAGQLPPEMQDLAKELHQSCLEETGVDESLLEPCMVGNFADDKKLHCYFKCYYSQVGAITEDGELDAEAFGSILPPEMHNLLPSIKACSTVKGTDACDVALNFNKCLQKADPVNFVII